MVSIIKTNTLKQDIRLKILIKFVCAIIGLVLCMLYKIPSGDEHRLFD